MNAVSAHFEDHRAALTGHCYCMLGSVADADDADAVQETMVRAWQTPASRKSVAFFTSLGFTYDLDGHHWEVLWMDPAAAA